MPIKLLIIAFLLLLGLLYFFAYRQDFKNDPQGFRDGASLLKMLALIVLIKIAFNITDNVLYPEDRFGKAFNPERMALGLITIPENWSSPYDHLSFGKRYLSVHNEDYNRFYYESDSLKHYQYKYIQVENDNILLEKDAFKKGSSWVFIQYHFPSAKFSYEIMENDQTRPLSKKAALDTLKKWRIR